MRGSQHLLTADTWARHLLTLEYHSQQDLREVLSKRSTEAEDRGVILIRVLTRVWIRQALKDKSGAPFHKDLHCYFQHSFWVHFVTRFYGKAMRGWGKAFCPSHRVLLRVWASESDRPRFVCWLCSFTTQMTSQVIYFFFQKIGITICIIIIIISIILYWGWNHTCNVPCILPGP